MDFKLIKGDFWSSRILYFLEEQKNFRRKDSKLFYKKNKSK